ncbi:MAG: hypothetical protein WB626_03920 [Bacteroidota bacterium]
MDEEGRIFRYRLDFYYQSALIYLLTLVIYGGIRGSLIEARFEYVLDDPLMYVILLFVVTSFGALALNLVRNRRLIVGENVLVFRHRFQDRRIAIEDIEWMHLGREVRVRTGGRSQVAVFKLKDRRRLLRVRVGRYERDRELIQELGRIAARVPRRSARRWRRPRFTDR